MKNEYLKEGRVNQKLETREKILSSTQELMNYGEKFTLEEPRRIYIFIRFYGNHTGAFSDISLGQPMLN